MNGSSQFQYLASSIPDNGHGQEHFSNGILIIKKLDNEVKKSDND
jgi:hypothetical protein